MDNTVLCVVGPTACGKTKMGVALARRFNGEVVSVDSMQLYRGMTIGTAAPTAEEMEGIPHHMVAVADPRESWSAARYTAEADKCVQDILRRGKRPVLVGGTGLYLDALVRGTDFAAGSHGGVIRQRLQQRVERQGAAALLAELQTIDPAAAARLHLRDEKRIVRALEVYYETGETITEHDRKSRETPPRYRALRIGLAFRDRADMWARIDRRVDDMVAQGLLQEVETLLQSGLPRDATALQAIGYGLLVLFFAIGVVKTCGSFVEVKRPEHALKLFIRFALAKAAVTYGLELMQAVFSIVQGTVSTVITQSGTSGMNSTTLPQELVDAINDVGFWDSIPLWAVTLIGGLLITVLSFVMILTVYGRMFSLWMYAAIAPIPLAAFAGEPTANVGKNFIRSYAGVRRAWIPPHRS